MMGEIAVKRVDEGKVSLELPKPDRVLAITSFIDVETGEGTIHVPVIPASFRYESMLNPDPERLYKEDNPPLTLLLDPEKIHLMQDTGPYPDRGI